MAIGEHLTEFAGKRVVDFQRDGKLPSPDKTIPRIRVEYEDEFELAEVLTDLLADPASEQLTGLVVGAWAGEELYETTSAGIVEALVAAAGQLPELRSLFLGDIIYEENEISWIQRADVSPLWAAYPKLERFGVRGSSGLSLGKIEHDYLTELVVECGGLPNDVIQQVIDAKLPALEHLELYLGSDNYGWEGPASVLEPILSGDRFPKLKYLGLRDSVVADELVPLVAAAPILDRIRVLDLSLGNLTDAGAQPLLERLEQTPADKQLERVDLHHHFLSDELMKRFEALPIPVDLSDRQEEDRYGDEVYRYIVVSE